MILGALFAGEAGDELIHAARLASAIVALGGVPTVQGAEVAAEPTPPGMLQRALEAERAALTSFGPYSPTGRHSRASARSTACRHSALAGR